MILLLLHMTLSNFIDFSFDQYIFTLETINISLIDSESFIYIKLIFFFTL